MNLVQSRDPITVSCPSCGAELTIEDGTEEFITCGYCHQVHQISDLVKESDQEQIGRIRMIHQLFPLKNIKPEEYTVLPEEEPVQAFRDSPRGKLLRCIMICLLAMIVFSLICGLLKPLIPLGLSLACCFSCWQIAGGKTAVKNPKAIRLLAALALVFFAAVFFV